MKHLILLLALCLSVNSYALPEPVRRLSVAEARTKTEPTARDIMRLQADPSKHAELMAKLERIVTINLNGVIAVDAVAKTSLMNLMNVNPREVLPEIARLSTTVKDPSVSAREKQIAQTTLRLMAEGARTISGVTRSAAEATAQRAAAVKVIELSNKIGALSASPSARKFVDAYEKALREGNNTEASVRIASKGKFTEKELRECE